MKSATNIDTTDMMILVDNDDVTTPPSTSSLLPWQSA